MDEARVVVVNRVRGRGRGSGVEVDATGAQLWTITGGKVRSVKLYQSKAEALEAVGLATSMTTLETIGLEDGYAQLGDVRLHYVEAGDGPLVVLLHGFPEFWFGWRRQIPALAAGRLPRRRAGHARLQPLVAPRRRRAPTAPTSWRPTSAT